MYSRELLLSRILIWTGCLTTLVISPGVGYDPINLPKMFVLVSGASMLLSLLVFEFKKVVRLNLNLSILLCVLVAALFVSLFTNDRPFFQQLWGIWGRSTGILTYLSFFIVMLSAMRIASLSSLNNERRYFERLSYFISIYTLIQAADLDPINWSQKLMVSTLGNINFMSSFLGLACISFFSRTVFESLSASSRLNYGFFLSLNLFLIILSESIQGIGVLLSGIVLVLAFQLRRKTGQMKTLVFLLSSFFTGFITLAGTAGFGPLSMLRQETVVYRIDYWLAGIAMTKANPLNGVGIDSYGDYYQQYRTLDAVLRTGPQRVTNTAHNIFLDVSSGSGIIAGLTFFGIFLIAIQKILKFLRDGQITSNQVVFASMFVGFMVFCMISINQIGVGVWGFIFLGFVLGFPTEKSITELRIAKGKRNLNLGESNGARSLSSKRMTVGKGLVSLLFLAIGSVAAYVPNHVDILMLRAVRREDFATMRKIATEPYSAVFHRNKFQTFAVDSGREEAALTFARLEKNRNNRNEISWRILAFSRASKIEERNQAVKSLIAMDPKNKLLREELRGIESR